MAKKKTKEAVTPNPGSDGALDAGCTCAVLDNNHGYGYMGTSGLFVVSADCPLHGCSENETTHNEGVSKRSENA